MKKVLLVLAVVLSTLTMNAQLSKTATFVKKELPTRYQEIRSMSINEWGSDHEMVVYTINKQSEALIVIMTEIMKSPSYDKDVFVRALNEWGTKEGYTDWTMVLYTYNNQIKNKNY